MAAPLAKEKVAIELTSALESRPYVLMTLECLEKFGIKVSTVPDLSQFEIMPQSFKPNKYLVERDWTSASYFLALGGRGR